MWSINKQQPGIHTLDIEYGCWAVNRSLPYRRVTETDYGATVLFNRSKVS